MTSYVGIDSRLFLRDVTKRDGTPGHFKSVIGAAITTRDFDKFDKAYESAIKDAFSVIKCEPNCKYYCTCDFSKFPERDAMIEKFFQSITPAINRASLFYTLFSKKRLPEVKVYGRLSQEQKLKLSAPTRTYDDFILGHLNQCFPAICAWRISELLEPTTTQFHLDSYEGHISEAQEEIEKNFQIFVYPHGDCSNPLISTADLLLHLLDVRLANQRKLLIYENIRPTLHEFGEKIHAYPISNKHLPKITPIDKIPVDTTSKIKHPVYWVFKTNPLVTNEFLKNSEQYRNLIDLAAGKGGVVKSFNKQSDPPAIQSGDYGVYFDTMGKETAEFYSKTLKKSIKLIKLDIMSPK